MSIVALTEQEINSVKEVASLCELAVLGGIGVRGAPDLKGSGAEFRSTYTSFVRAATESITVEQDTIDSVHVPGWEEPYKFVLVLVSPADRQKALGASEFVHREIVYEHHRRDQPVVKQKTTVLIADRTAISRVCTRTHAHTHAHAHTHTHTRTRTHTHLSL